MKTSFWTRIFDLIAPRPCAICGRRLSVNESLLCAVCHLHLPFTHYEKDPTDNPVARLFWGHFPVERAVALVYFIPKSEAGEMIYDMKYRGQADIGYDLGTIMAKQLAEQRFFDGIDALVSIPLHRHRLRERGYNQCDYIAQGIQQVTGIPLVKSAVQRIKDNPSQTHLQLLEREQNVANAFRVVRPELLESRHVLLIDDVMTTGATLLSCMQEMAKINGIRLSAFTIAYAGMLPAEQLPPYYIYFDIAPEQISPSA